MELFFRRSFYLKQPAIIICRIHKAEKTSLHVIRFEEGLIKHFFVYEQKENYSFNYCNGIDCNRLLCIPGISSNQ